MAKIYSGLKRMFILTFITLLLNAVFSTNGAAQPVVTFRTYMTGLPQPLDIVNAGDGSNRLFIVQKNGTIRIIRDSAILPTAFLEIPDSIVATGGEQGLLSMAFHPQYETNRLFFVYYTNTDGDITLNSFQASLGNPDVADESTGKILLTIPKGPTNHNGGDLNFGSDGYLYFGTGDGGGGFDVDNNAQNGNVLLGKMLRLNVDPNDTPPYYTIPSDNPFVGNPGVRDEIWAIGLRNPWRWSFDRANNNMWIADVGQDEWEELNLTGCGPIANYTFPIYEYPHDSGISVTGGFVYRGPEFPALVGYYLMSDFGSGHLWKIAPNGSGGWNSYRQPGLMAQVVSYGEAENGALYASTLNNGTIWKIESSAGAPLPVTLVNFQAQSGTGVINLSWETSFEQNLKQFEVQFSEDNIDFNTAGVVPALNTLRGETYRFNHTVFNKQRVYYRLRMVDLDGSFEYSRTITLDITGNARNYVFPTINTNGTIGLYLTETFENVEIVDMSGRLLRKQLLSGRTGRIDIQLPSSATGTVVVRLNHIDRSKSFTQKVFVR
jgi:hypothetical protein